MRLERFYAWIGLFVGGAIALSVLTGLFIYDLQTHKNTNYVMFFNGSLNGLSTSSTITYQGVNIGEVKLIELAEDAQKNLLVPVYVNFYIEQSFLGKFKSDPILHLLQQGYVASIKEPNLLTGVASIHLVKSHEPRPYHVEYYHGHPIFPTTKREEGLGTVDITLKVAQKTLEDLGDFIRSAKFLEMIDAMKAMGGSIAQLANQLDQRAPNLIDTLSQSLSHVSNAANSLQNLTDYLSRNPESLLRGRK